MSQPAEVASNRLNFLSKKRRAVSSVASRQIIPASNGNSFPMASTINLDIPGNQASTFLDFQNSYVRFTITNRSAHDFQMNSAYSLFQTCEILTDGQTISSIQNYGAAVSVFLDTEVSSETRARYLSLLVGTTSGNGITIAAGQSLTLCMALVLTPLFNSSKYIPVFGRSNLRIRLTLADTARALQQAGGLVIDNSNCVLSPVDFVGSFIRLSAPAMALINQNTGGRYELVTIDMRVAEGAIAANDTTLNQNLGFSFSSLDKVFFGIFPTYSDRASNSTANRARFALSEYAISINGEEYPRRGITTSATNLSETVAEMAISTSSLANFQHQTNLIPPRFVLANPDGETVDDTGKYVAFVDTESMKPHTDDDAIYSGISTLGATTQLVGSFSAGAPRQATLLVFAQYTMSMSLDLNGTGTWVVAV